MRVFHAHLVFHEEIGPFQFANVVVMGPNPS